MGEGTTTGHDEIQRIALALIAARSRNGVIGREGDLPWRLADDLAFFKAQTLAKPCCMGRKTWESLPFALPGRANLVLTRDPAYADLPRAEGAHVFTDMHAMLAHAADLSQKTGADEVMVIGGAQLYAHTLPLADRLYLTEVDAHVEGDVRFPDFEEAAFEEFARQHFEAGARNDHAFVVRSLRRRASL